MSQQNPTIIVGHLDSTELTKSIDKLVAEVAKKTSGMAEDFTQAIDKMKFAMKDFAITQKVSVDLMKEAWRDMSRSFDAMVAAQSGATGGGKGSGKGKVYAPNTVGALEQEIALEKEKRREMLLGSVELHRQNILLEKRRKLLKEETSSPYQKIEKSFSKEFGAANSMSAKTLQQAEDKLKRLIDLQNKFKGSGLIDETKMNRLQKAIDGVTDKITKLRNAKPKSLKDVLGMDANSIDQIAAKMRALKMVRIDPNNAAEVKRVGDAYAELKRKQAQLMGQNIQLTHSNNYLAQSFGYIRNRIVYALTLGAISNFIKQLYEIRGQYELLERSLGVLVGSFEKGTQIFNELNEMAIKSPFTLIELGTAAKQLTAYNFAANEVVDTTRRLADISAALGVPMERLTYNLGQIKAQGILNARDARDFANAGLAIVPMLAKMYTEQKTFGDEMVTTAQVYDMMSKKMVTYGDVLKVLYRVTDEGGKFFDFQAKQADTLRVQMANLTLAYNNMLNEIGSENQGVLVGMVSGLKTLLKHWREISRVLLTVITTLGVYKGVSAVVAALNSKMFVGGVLVGLRNYINGIKNATGAMATFNAVTKGNPIGMLIGLLTAAISYFVLFKNTVEDASEEVEMFGESAAKSINKVKTLQKILQGTEETSSTYKKTLSELSQIAKEYGIQIDAEKASRDEANKSAERTIELIREESAERQRANQLEKARERYEEQTSKAKSDFTSDLQGFKDFGYTDSVSKELVDNADAISDVVSSIIEDNIQLVVGKTKEEADKGLDEIKNQIQQGLTRMGISKEASKLLFENVQGGLLDLIVAYRDAAEAQENYNQKTENYYQKSKKITNATMTFTEKVDANARALRNNADDAVQLYNRIRDIVETFSKTHNIDFKLNLIAEKPPKWMFDKSLPELQRLAIAFASIAASGGKAVGHTVESTHQRAIEYAAAAKQMQEEEERKARMKETKTKTKKGGGHKKDVLGDALTEEIKLIKDIQNSYKEYKKVGVDTFTAVELVADRYNKSLETQNAILSKFGITGLTGKQLANMDLHKVRDFYQQMLDVASRLKNTKGVEALENAIGGINDEIVKVDYKRITEGLNNKLGQLKDEYELAVALDADPELGNVFANMMGIDMESLPHTVKEYADRYSTYLNKYLKGKNSSLQFTGDELRGLTRDDITAFREQVDAGSFNQEWFDAIKKAYDDIQGKRRKDIEDTEKWKNSLIEKYGNLQDKLTKIYKDSVQNQVDAVKTFGTEDQKSEIVRLQLRLDATDDPAELADINLKIAGIVKDVTDKNPIALKLVSASDNQTKADTSKAYWEDFKNNDALYAMTFEDMANNSTRAIQLIIDKLEGLKDKVKEDPVSMKALMKSLEDAQKELNTRDPFGGVARSLRDMANASQEAKTTQEALWRAEVDVEQAQQEVDNSEDGTPEEQAAAQQKLADAVQRRTAAQKKLTAAENNGKKAQEQLKASLQGISGQLDSVKGLFDVVAELFRAGGDDETADAIKGINEGFTIMTQVISAVGIALTILESENPWLLAAAAALSVIVGLVSFLSGNSNKKITEKVEESERAVKRLENTYKDLEYSIEQAYGTAEYGARRAAIANRQLQLVELQRQLSLEESRDSKNRDEDRILELKGKIIDLRNEIKQSVDEITNDLLGISSIGDAAEQLVSSMIEAFKQGEDYMKQYDESFEKMIDNMIMKAIVSRVIGDRIEQMWNQIKAVSEQRGEADRKRIEELTKQLTEAQDKQMSMQAEYDDLINDNTIYSKWFASLLKKDVDSANSELERIKSELAQAEKDYAKAVEPTKEDIDSVRNMADGWRESVKNEFEYWMSAFGIKYGEGEDKQLSNLQQGISGITEDTANALEAYMNIVSQRVFYNGSLLEQIRDAVVGMDMDVQTATQAQMLLQLQQSYQVQMSIQGILQGVLTPSGRAFSVELLS